MEIDSAPLIWCCCVSAAVYLPLCTCCCVSAAVYLLLCIRIHNLCIHHCVSATVSTVSYIHYCVCCCSSTTVYPLLCICHRVSAAVYIVLCIPATVSATATRAMWQVHPTNENASSRQTKCITIRQVLVAALPPIGCELRCTQELI